MSIATLKKKSFTQYNNMSVGSKTGFSLNGTRRSQGYVGQTSLSRSLPRTLMKGDTIKGHGGCCGFYPIKPIVQSAVTSLNDSSVVKSSVINNLGMINSRYRWIRRPAPFSSVKPDVNNNINTQGQFIDNLSRNAIKETESCGINTKVGFTTRSCATLSKIQRPTACNFIDDPTKTQILTGSQYIEQNLNKKCTANDIAYIAKNVCGAPLL
jgi:hypothetical protein